MKPAMSVAHGNVSVAAIERKRVKSVRLDREQTASKC